MWLGGKGKTIRTMKAHLSLEAGWEMTKEMLAGCYGGRSVYKTCLVHMRIP